MNPPIPTASNLFSDRLPNKLKNVVGSNDRNQHLIVGGLGGRHIYCATKPDSLGMLLVVAACHGMTIKICKVMKSACQKSTDTETISGRLAI
jgi:hypothetical protein